MGNKKKPIKKVKCITKDDLEDALEDQAYELRCEFDKYKSNVTSKYLYGLGALGALLLQVPLWYIEVVYNIAISTDTTGIYSFLALLGVMFWLVGSFGLAIYLFIRSLK